MKISLSVEPFFIEWKESESDWSSNTDRLKQVEDDVNN